jgi:hypothetical protein
VHRERGSKEASEGAKSKSIVAQHYIHHTDMDAARRLLQ